MQNETAAPRAVLFPYDVAGVRIRLRRGGTIASARSARAPPWGVLACPLRTAAAKQRSGRPSCSSLALPAPLARRFQREDVARVLCLVDAVGAHQTPELVLDDAPLGDDAVAAIEPDQHLIEVGG